MLLNDVCEMIVDCEHKTAPIQIEGYPSIRTPNIGRGYFLLDGVNRVSEETYQAWTARAVPQYGDLIMAREAPVGNVAMVPYRLQPCLGQRTLLIRPKVSIILPHYLVYLLISDDVQNRVHAMTNGVTVPHLNMKDIRELRLPSLPPLPTQQKIAAILSAYDDLIENNLRRIKLLEEMAQNLYREWFVKFRFPGHEHACFVASPLGQIPDGWSISSISAVAIVHRGRAYSGTELADEGGLPFINLKCMDRDGGFRVSGIKRYTGSYKSSQTVRYGEIVMAITDMTQERRIVARAGRVPRLDTAFGVVSMDLVRIASRGIIPESYIYSMLRWSGFADNVKQYANGANVLHLLPARIEEYCFVCPEPDIATRFGDIIASIHFLSDSLEQKNILLRNTRDLLLPKLIACEIDVSELSITVPEEVHT